MKALIIDHDDSFTFNLRHWLFAICDDIEIVNHHRIHDQNFLEYDLVVLSPGPKSPKDYPHVINWLEKKYFKKPIFGVCLGMQLMTLASGGTVESYSPPQHGKKSKLNTNLPGFKDLEVARYHSLYCSDVSQFDLIALSENIPMWIEHKTHSWLGLQFHPESFLTEKTSLLQNYIRSWIKK